MGAHVHPVPVDLYIHLLVHNHVTYTVSAAAGAGGTRCRWDPTPRREQRAAAACLFPQRWQGRWLGSLCLGVHLASSCYQPGCGRCLCSKKARLVPSAAFGQRPASGGRCVICMHDFELTARVCSGAAALSSERLLAAARPTLPSQHPRFSSGSLLQRHRSA